MGQVALPQFYGMMAEVLLLESDLNGATDWVQRAISLMNADKDLYFAAELHRLAALCLRQEGKRSAAVEQLRIALNVARVQGAKLFELRAALDLAALEPVQGDAEVTEALTNFPEPEPWPELIRAGRC